MKYIICVNHTKIPYLSVSAFPLSVGTETRIISGHLFFASSPRSYLETPKARAS